MDAREHLLLGGESANGRIKTQASAFASWSHGSEFRSWCIRNSNKMSNYARVIHHATSILCCNKGSMDLLQLYRKVYQRFGTEEDDFWYIVKKCPRFAVVKTRERTTGELGSDCIIVAKTSLRLCKNYSKQECTDCQELHLCKYFVYGNCRYGKGRKPCKYSHDVQSEHNFRLLRECTLHELHEDELFLLLLQNDPSLLPEVCSHYNKGSGPYGSCTFRDGCTKLHLCLHLLQGDCMFGSRCKRLHAADQSGHRMLQERGLGDDIIQDLPIIYQNVYRLTVQTTDRGCDELVSSGPQVEEKSEICLHFLRRNCRFQEQCMRVHFNLPYKWEVWESGTWRDLRQMEQIERAFCNPHNTHSPSHSPVDFLSMKRGYDSVRRLSTVSSVTKPTHYILTTFWLWYYKGDHGNWIEYGQPDEKGRVTSLSSRELEEAYLRDDTAEIAVTKGHRLYYISFHDMYQRNTKHNTKRRIRRRPRFVSISEVEDQTAR
ncbi:protein mono-ADP-ribosyltransferase PARP12b [Clupea harengus]|uniref:Protein mono-ADP-ribosyltransferase PARP12b n=1 Tax=Clupea harengus TaxID=7950 RepID=A0A6P3WEA1_CLUHA|nr:protein mono-ADP-ribosyltransferase PARP12b [Clupea harengus]